MCPSEHVHTAVSPGTSAVFEVSIRRTVTLSPQLSQINPIHKNFGIGIASSAVTEVTSIHVYSGSSMGRSDEPE